MYWMICSNTLVKQKIKIKQIILTSPLVFGWRERIHLFYLLVYEENNDRRDKGDESLVSLTFLGRLVIDELELGELENCKKAPRQKTARHNQGDNSAPDAGQDFGPEILPDNIFRLRCPVDSNNFAVVELLLGRESLEVFLEE